MQTAGTRQTSFFCYFRYGHVVIQQSFGIFQREVLKKFFGAYPRPIFEHPLKMKRAEADLPGYFVQIRLRFKIVFQKVNGLFYFLKVSNHGSKLIEALDRTNPILAQL